MKKLISTIVATLLIASSAYANNVNVTIDGDYVDAEGVIIEGRTLVPGRAVTELLGAAAEWDGSVRQVTVEHSNANIILIIDEPNAQLNGETVELDVPAQILNDRTFVPLRFIADSFGMEVDFISGVVVLTTQGNNVTVAEPSPPAQPPVVVTTEFNNALSSARGYLNIFPMSIPSLRGQLAFEGFPPEAIDFAISELYDEVDWYYNAVRSGRSYLDLMGMSEQSLHGQLTFDGFTASQATHAVNTVDTDWYYNAVRSARSYLDLMSFSRQSLHDQLTFDGFTNAQATHAVNIVFD